MKRILSLIILSSTLLSLLFTASCTKNSTETGALSESEGAADPAEISFDITELLLQTRNNFTHSFDFTECTVGTCKANKYISLTGESFTRDKKKGLVGSDREIGAVGFSERIVTFPYTAEAYLYANDSRRGDETVKAGILCRLAEDTHTSSGLWFSFAKNTVKAYIQGGLDCTVTNSLPFDCKDGVKVSFSGTPNEIKVSANETHIATVQLTESGLSLKDSNGGELAKCGTDNVIFEEGTHGYFRVETDRCKSIIGSISLSHTSEEVFTPDETVYAFMTERGYSFKDKQAFMHTAKTKMLDGKIYADAETLFKMFDFTYVLDGEVVKAERGNASIAVTSGRPFMSVNGEEKPFTSIKSIDGGLYMCVDSFAKILGYTASFDSASGICTVYPANSEIPSDKKTLAADNFKLYDEVVFNYDDVECSKTGVGKLASAPFEKRIVGISYTTWHRNTKTWWKNTWGTPIIGEYESQEEDVLRYHAELLAAAGVDFVFVDWSNNTTISEATLETAEDFRMIEHSTYKMFEVWKTVPNAPKIALFLGPGHAGQSNVDNGKHQKKADQVYSSFVENEEYGDMYYYYEGKPLLICYGATPNKYGENPKWTDDRFTIRWMTGYVGQQPSLYDRKLCSERFWSWEERSPQTYTQLDGVVETVTCSAATRGESEASSELRSNGATLKKQVQRAYDLGAKMIIFTTWNEWTSSEQKNPERSRDLEPSVEYGTFYYDLMCQQIKKFKGKI